MKNAINKTIILDYLQMNDLSKTKFSKICKVSLKTVNKILNGDQNFSLIALFKISRVLNVSMQSFFI